LSQLNQLNQPCTSMVTPTMHLPANFDVHLHGNTIQYGTQVAQVAQLTYINTIDI
jgi:hypothetical protein